MLNCYEEDDDGGHLFDIYLIQWMFFSFLYESVHCIYMDIYPAISGLFSAFCNGYYCYNKAQKYIKRVLIKKMLVLKFNSFQHN